MIDTSTTSAVPFIPVQKEDIAVFADKLVRWGAALSPKEQALVQVLVDRARGLVPDDVKQHQLRVDLGAALQSVYTSCAEAWHSEGEPGWVRVDPVWYKAGPIERGEYIDFTVRIMAQNAPAAPVTEPLATSTAGASAASASPSPAPGSPSPAPGGPKPVTTPPSVPAKG